MVVVKKNTAHTEHETKLHGSEIIKNNALSNHLTGSAEPELQSSNGKSAESSHNREYSSVDLKWSENIVERGKDLLSKDASSVATTAAIIIGAALIEVELLPGLIIGAGAILLGKVFPEISGYVRPAVKGMVRAGFNATHKVRQIIAEASEQVSDLVAEVKQEQHLTTTQDHSLINTDPINKDHPKH
jgi:hypothetical protein